MREYLVFKKQEFIDLSIITLVLATLFAIFFYRFEVMDSFLPLWIIIIIFLTILLFSRLIVMKAFAYRHGFEIILHQTYFSKYGPRKIDSIEAFTRDFMKKKIKGIPSIVLITIIYILSLGYIIIPSTWRYHTKKIPHKFIGTKEKFEYGMGFMIRRSVTQYRVIKTIFVGFIYYFFFSVITKLFIPTGELYYSLQFMTYWIAFITLLPVPGFEGYDFYVRSRLGYFSTYIFLILGLLCIILFESVIAIFSLTAITGLILIFIMFYKYFLFD